MFRTLLITLIVFAFAVDGAAQSAYWVVGRVVDDNECPVAGAIVLLDQKHICNGCLDQIIPAFKTEADGEFLLRSVIPIDSNARLIIGGPLPVDVWAPFRAGDPYLQKIEDLNGIKLKTSSPTNSIQVGDLRPQFLYRSFMVDLGELFNSKNILKETSIMRFDLFFKDTKVADDLCINEQAIDREKQTIQMALPKGEWRITFKVANKRELNIKATTIKLN